MDGYSLDAQKDKLRKYAEYQDMTIVSEFFDEGFSGKNIKGRRRTEKKIGTRNEMHIVEQWELSVYEGCQEAIISEMLKKNKSFTDIE